MRFLFDVNGTEANIYLRLGKHAINFRAIPYHGMDVKLISHLFTRRTPYWFVRYPWSPYRKRKVSS